jgi:plasmid stabilization system protein ParE
LLAQLDWLSDRTPRAALDAAEQIRRTLALLLEFPMAAPAWDDHHRDATIRFGRDGFVVRYRIDGDVITITRVFHGRQAR